VNAGRQKIMRAIPVEVEPARGMTVSPAELGVGRTADAVTLDCWLLSREALAPEADALARTLSEDERVRRDRFVRTEDRVRFGLYRGALRALLSLYVAAPPERIRFRFAAGGKPELDPASHPDAPCFNLSHSGDACCIAIARAEVGVDVEFFDRAADTLAVARHSFHPAEAEALAALDDAARRALFIRWWTAKEALLKARGLGLAGGLGRIDLSGWRQGEAARVEDETGTTWILRSYSFERGALALAAPYFVRSIILRSISGPGAAFGALITRSS
jgi:4'-phosphopantetheinyl transferase